MKKKNLIRIVSFLGAVTVVSVGFLIKSEQKNMRYKLALENVYSKNLDDFNTSINNISSTLNKARFVTTPKQLSSMAAKLLAEAELSKSALSQLPQSKELTSLNRFLSQVGNYAMSVTKNLISGENLNADHVTNIEKLSDAANKISQLVSESQITYNNADYWAKELENKVNEITDENTLADSLSELEDEISDMPSLIYDGPYSDHILEKEPSMIKNAAEVSENEALKMAAKIAVCDESELKSDGFIDGSIPSYRFSNDKVTVTVSKNGGYGVTMRKQTETGNTELTYDQAREKAKRYLSLIDMNGFRETYYFASEGVCTINFAYVDGETICYTDLVKVGVAMDSGDIVFYEASGYLSNHRTRAFKSPDHTAEEAQKLVSSSLTVKSTALALIPTQGGDEVRCYEFSCISSDKQEILIYINTATLEEEDILILLKTDGGTLVK